MTKKLTPNVRFKGFSDDWEQCKVSELFKIMRGKVLATDKITRDQSDAAPYPVYSSQTKNNGLLGFYKDYLFNDAITWTTDGANAGTVRYRSGKFYSTNVNGVLLSNRATANICISEILNKVAYKHVSQVGNPKLMNNVMSEIEIIIPQSKMEQEKISRMLQSVNKIIDSNQKKLDQLKQLKKLFLQKIFNQEWRFKRFTDPWEQRKLGTALKKLDSGTSVNSGEYDTGYYILKTSAVKSGRVNLLERKPIIQAEIERARTSVQKGSIIISRMNTPILVGASGLVSETHSNIFIPDRLWQSQVNDNYCEEWLVSCLNIPINIQRIRSLATGTSGSMKNISKDSILNFTLRVPKIQEQRVIGRLMVSLDQTIASNQKKLEQLKQLKKWFLQNMFV